MKLKISKVVMAFCVLSVLSCEKKKDEQMNEVETIVKEKEKEKKRSKNGLMNCTDPSKFVFNENNGYILAEFEDANIKANSNWKIRTKSGVDFGVWLGNQSFGKPGNGKLNFKVNITTPGVYRFLFNSAVTKGKNGTEHNDTWVRFADASDFFGERNGKKVYPRGVGKTPNPKGNSSNGWLKVYRSGSDLDFKWQASTSDNESLNVYAQFDTPGTYTMEVSARSSYHAIDKFMLYQESTYTFNQARALTQLSAITCN